MLQKDKPAHETLEQRNVVEIAVCSGSAIANKFIKDVHWPHNTLLVDVKRGEEQIIPSGDTRLMAGDFIYVLTENEYVEELQAMASGEE